MRTERRTAKIDLVLRHRQPDLTVVLENIHDPHNVSAIFRSCDAAGVMEAQLVYTQEEFPAIGKRSSASAGEWIDQRKFRSVEECYATLRREGFLLFATHLDENAVSLYDLDLTQKVALVFGNEHRGLSSEAAKYIDANFHIPMMGMIQSLNVSVACAVTLFEAVRQRKAQGAFDSPKISDERLESLSKEWLKK
jgi:tRNA (guanosine-2'-O-)-methyltransferase